MKARYPRSLILFAITAIIFVLQIPAGLGVILMVMGAAFWPMLLVNLGFAGVAMEVMLERVSRLWLIAPVLWFGGYLCVAAINHGQAQALAEQVAAQNAVQHLSFAPATQALMLAAGPEGSRDELAAALLQTYDLPVIYVETGRPDGPAHMALKLGNQASCAATRGRLAEAASLRLYPIREGYSSRSDVCVYAGPQEPAQPVLRVELDWSGIHRGGDGWLPTRFSRVSLRAPDGRTARVTSGSVRPLSWFPSPLLGCYLNDARPAWVCGGSFGGGPAIEIDRRGGSDAGVIGQALHLTPSSVDARRSGLGMDADPEIARAIDRRVQRSLAQLDRILREPTAPNEPDELLGLGQRPDLLAPRAEAIVTAMTALLSRPAGLDRARALQDLLATLDGGTFRRVAPAILAAFEPPTGRPHLSSALAERLGDAGRSALPLLFRLVEAELRGSDAPGAMRGICRIGPDAAAVADRVAAVLARTDRSDDTYFAAYVTLLRMSRPDLTDRDDDAQSTYAADTYAEARHTPDPARHAEMCVTTNGWRGRGSQQR